MNDIALYEKVPSIENNFTIKFRLYATKKTLPPHWHEHVELIYFKSGKCDFHCNGKTFGVMGGDLVAINGMEIHAFDVIEPVDFFSILLYPEFFADVNTEGIQLENHIKADEHIKALFENIYEEYKKNDLCAHLMMKSHTYSLASYLMQLHTASKISKKETELQEIMLERINKVIQHITKSYGEKITTLELAGMCYLSEAHFCRFFKKYVGKSATEYINEYRVEKAAILLLGTSESISYVSSLVGFDDANYFSRVFKKIKGMSPGKYRKMRQTVAWLLQTIQALFLLFWTLKR